MTPQKIKQYSISLCLLALNFSCVQIPNFFVRGTFAARWRYGLEPSQQKI